MYPRIVIYSFHKKKLELIIQTIISSQLLLLIKQKFKNQQKTKSHTHESHDQSRLQYLSTAREEAVKFIVLNERFMNNPKFREIM